MNRHTLLFLLVSACFCLTARANEPAHAPHQHASSPGAAPVASPLAVPLDAAALAAFPRQAVAASAHGQSLRCEGIPLPTLLRAARALPEEPLRGPGLAKYVLVTARDGYRAAFSLAELEPTLGNQQVLLVDRCDGKPLDEKNGPLRLIAPGESRPARWVRQVHSITVVSAP